MTPSMNRSLVAALAALLLLAASAVAQVAGDASGQPPLVVRPVPSYYIWADGAGWHVRWVTPFPAIFSGTVTTNGEFGAITRAGGISILNRLDSQRLVFGSAAFAGAGGFDFQTSGTNVSFNLQVNGRTASPAQVHVGRLALNPLGVPFVLASAGTLGGREPYLSDVDRPVDRDR